MGNDGNYNDYDDAMNDLSEIQKLSIITGPLGIDPVHFTEFMFFWLFAWFTYLFIPKGIRFMYCGSYPKRYAWSARSKQRRQKAYFSARSSYNYSNGQVDSTTASLFSLAETTSTMNGNHKELPAQGIGTDGNGSVYSNDTSSRLEQQPNQFTKPMKVPEDEIIDLSSPIPQQSSKYQQSQGCNNKTPMNQTIPPTQPPTPFSSGASTFNDEIAISTTMQQLRDTGIQIIAHGSKGKPKTVRLVLTENAITWRTESTKRNKKVGKSHQVPLTQIMYVDVGKQTTALRRVENASLADNICFSLLTRDGSLDLEASSPQERDALVNCFSLVLDEVHAQNWRDLYRAPSSDLPSSFDDFDLGSSNGPGQRMEV